MSKLFIKIFNSRRFVKVKEVNAWPILILDSARATIPIDLDDVKLGAKLLKIPSGYAVEKIGEGRILLNGRPVHTGAIRPGDVLTIDTYDFGIYLSEPSPTIVPPLFGRMVDSEEETLIGTSPDAKKAIERQEPQKEITDPEKTALFSEQESEKPQVPEETPTELPQETLIEPPKPKAEPKKKPATVAPPVKAKTPAAPKIPESTSTQFTESGMPKSSTQTGVTRTTRTQPKKGGLVRRALLEVLVVWEDKVMATHHFEGARDILIGGHEDCDIQLPVFAHKNIQHRIMQIGVQTKVFLTQRLKGELFSNGQTVSFEELISSRRLVREGGSYSLVLDRNESITITLPGTPLKLVVLYVPQAPTPILAPFLDLTASEMTGLAMSVLLAVMLSFFVSVNAPKKEEKGIVQLAQPERFAQLIYEPKPPPKEPEPDPPKEEPKKEVEPPKPKVEKVELAPIVKKEKKQKPKVQKIKFNETKKKKKKVRRLKPKRKKLKAGIKKKKTAPATRIRPKKLPKAPKKVTSVRQGMSKKVNKKKGASAATKKKDITKVGVLGILASKGTRKSLDKAASGTGVLTGLAAKATGGIGEDKNLDGALRGQKLKDDGAGGKGLSTVGIENIGTKGLGTGDQGYGSSTLGDRVRPEIEFGGDEEDFVGKIDKEAIRRVINSHKNQVRNCYERELNKDRTLGGKIVVKWGLGVGGKAISPRVVSSSLTTRVRPSSANPKNVEGCIVSRLASWRFPEPPPGVIGVIEYPFSFVPRN